MQGFIPLCSPRVWPVERWLLPMSSRQWRPGRERYLKQFPSAVEMLQGAGILHRQMDIRDGQLVGQIIDVLHALLHLGQLLFKQLQPWDAASRRQKHRQGDGETEQWNEGEKDRKSEMQNILKVMRHTRERQRERARERSPSIIFTRFWNNSTRIE